MAGLNPEQIAQIRAYEIGNERNRQQPISTMIEAQLGLSREDLDAQRVALSKAQENRISQLLGPEIQERAARAKAALAAQAYDEARLRQFNNLSDLEKQSLAEDIAGKKALTQSRQASTSLTILQEQLARTNDPLERQKIQSQIDHFNAQTKEVGEARKSREEQYKSGHVDINLPDKDAPGGFVTKKIPAKDVYDTIANKGGTIADTEFNRQDKLQQREVQATERAKKLQDEGREAEMAIKGLNDKGVPNVNNPAVEVKVEEHKAKSDDPYYYRYNPSAKTLGIGPGASVEKIPLIDHTGKPLKVKIIYERWLKYQQTNKAISFDDFVDKFIKGK